MRKIFISTSTFAESDSTPIELLKEAGFSPELNPYGRRLLKEEVLRLVSDAEGLIAGLEPLDRQTLTILTNLKVISRCGAGLDSVDLEAAKELSIKVFNTTDVLTVAVAELTIGLILALLRKIPLTDREMRAGLWTRRMGNLFCGKRLGIVGFGRIGRKVAEYAKGLGADLFYCDSFVNEEETPGFAKVGLKEILKKSDIITLHLPYSKENDNLLGKDELFLMKEGAFLINSSRGGIVDEDALYVALKEGRLAGAAIDVFKEEPYRGPLKELDNVILTSHIGSYAKEARVRMEIEAVKNLLAGFKDK